VQRVGAHVETSGVGHVLGCRAREGRVQYQVCRDWLIKLDGRRSDRRPPSNQEKLKP
jgi:hypothetical protein